MPLYGIRGGNMGGDEYRVLNVPRCRVVQTGAQAFASGTNTAIVFDSPNLESSGGFDTDSFYDPAVSRTQIGPKTPGLYDIKATVAFTGSNLGAVRAAWLQKNGSAALRYGMVSITVVAAIASNSICNIATSMPLNAEDYLELYGVQDSGAPLSTTSQGGIAPDAEITLCLISTLG